MPNPWTTNRTAPTTLPDAAPPPDPSSAIQGGIDERSAPAVEPTPLVVADLGGTHLRFALAEVAEGEVLRLGDPVRLATADHPSFEAAWDAFAAMLDEAPPPAAALAVAAPVDGDSIALTNLRWTLDRVTLPERLGVDRLTIINDIAAVARALPLLDPRHLLDLNGAGDLPDEGVTTVIGAGTGLGVAQLIRRGDAVEIVATEAGHAEFAPTDAIEEAIVHRLRRSYTRVSIERIVSGPGLLTIAEEVAHAEGHAAPTRDLSALWATALDGSDPLAAAALERWMACLGSVAGDLALTQGASAVAIAGGVATRIGERLARSRFSARFVAKGRFRARLAAISVKLVTHPEPGLVGAAAAFARDHG